MSVLWDRDGTRYKKGKGLRQFANGNEIASSAKLGPLTAKLPAAKQVSQRQNAVVNFAVNNDRIYFPRLTVSYSKLRTPPAKLIDGNTWYYRDPPNRWSCEGIPNAADSVVIDLGTERAAHRASLFFLHDRKGFIQPEKFDMEYWDGKA